MFYGQCSSQKGIYFYAKGGSLILAKKLHSSGRRTKTERKFVQRTSKTSYVCSINVVYPENQR